MVTSAPRVFRDPPVIVGHRGLGRGVVDGHSENTLSSLLAAAAIASWVEVDIRRTADDALVVHHHPALPDRRPIATASTADATTAGLLLLEELLTQLPAATGINLEIKSALEDALPGSAQATAALVAPVAAKTATLRPVLVSSLDPSALGIVSDLAPGLPRGLISWITFPVGIAVAAAAGLGVDVLSIHVRSLEPNRIEPQPQHPGPERVIEVAHQSGLEVLAWCPDPGQAGRLATAGVDALCVNDPRAAQRGLSTYR